MITLAHTKAIQEAKLSLVRQRGWKAYLKTISSPMWSTLSTLQDYVCGIWTFEGFSKRSSPPENHGIKEGEVESVYYGQLLSHLVNQVVGGGFR